MATAFDKPLPKNYSSCRELRNVAEKQRRDKLNHYVNELSTLVPFIAEHKSQKRVDKISVLRLAASYIRLHKMVEKEKECFSGKRLSSFKMNASQALLKAIGGFLLVISSSGKVVYASEAVEDTFGYTQTDILGQSFFHFIHEDDKKLLKKQLLSQESPRRSFYCRMLEKGSRTEPIRYEIIHVVGTLKEIHEEPQQSTTELEGYHRLRPRKRSRSASSVELEDDSTGEELDCVKAPDSHMLISFVKIVRDRPITEVSWVESMRDEYITRHRIDGAIAHVDHRISFVTGMIPEEVIGQLAYGYIHQDDVIWSLLRNRKMFINPEGQGGATVRLACKDGKYVALRTRGFLEVNKSTGEVDTFVCINTVVSKNDAVKEIMRERKELLAELEGKSPEELIKELVSQLPPSLLMLLKNLLVPSVIQKMLQNGANFNLDDDQSMTVQPRALARKFVSLSCHSRMSAEELQFKVEPENPIEHGPQDSLPATKRQRKNRHSPWTPEEIDLQCDSVDLVPQSNDRSLDLSEIDICNASSHGQPYDSRGPQEMSQFEQINSDQDFVGDANGDMSSDCVEINGSECVLDTNVLTYMPAVSESSCAYIENSCKQYMSSVICTSSCTSFSTYNS